MAVVRPLGPGLDLPFVFTPTQERLVTRPRKSLVAPLPPPTFCVGVEEEAGPGWVYGGGGGILCELCEFVGKGRDMVQMGLEDNCAGLKDRGRRRRR